MEKTRQVRPSIRAAAVAAVILLLCLLAAMVWSRSQRGAEEELRAVVGPPESVAYPSPQVPADRNAALPLREAVRLLEVPEAHRSDLVALTLVPDVEWTAPQRELADRFLAANPDALAQLPPVPASS